ncbi:predicted protein [Uncinocarpus reesii 1704]|uniref:non-specific serine/threonine protein kinase n=1 Tax=Uncinocarpus reesii (strain UAMH 1704) TaxID=336963 RepID=C4JQ46_UNCRE|nr:uncharacterized protein UREG_03279 [Uncinocarpus reesii 1704]EEP78433.1 predicted protein [Uncinocarpus reesii 1704]
MIESQTFAHSVSPWLLKSPRKNQGRILRSKKVYGKRLDSANAVLERDQLPLQRRNANAKIQAVDVTEVVAALQEKLAGFTLDEDLFISGERNMDPDIAREIERALLEISGQPIQAVSKRAETKKSQEPAAEEHQDPVVIEPVKTKQKRIVSKKEAPKTQPPVPTENAITKYATPILEEAMSNKTVDNFDTWANRAGDMFDVEKISEGSYGEVYQLPVRTDYTKRELSQTNLMTLKEYDNGVFKIVPLRAQSGAGSKKFTSIQEVVAEVQMLKLLDPIPGFARFRDVHVHRDLHLGNICIKSTRPNESPDEPFKLPDNVGPGFGLSGMETTIIDYSLSRASINMHDTSMDEDTVWSDLDKKKLFDAIGQDDDEKLLRDTYRLMRREVYRDQDPGHSRSEPWRWKESNPRTNLIWLSFVLTMLLSKGQTDGILPVPQSHLTPVSPRSTNTGNEKQGENDDDTDSLDIQLELLDRLQTVLDVLNPEKEEEDVLLCAGDLVAFGIGSQWLVESDFLC